jgi:hypothetical protein
MKKLNILKYLERNDKWYLGGGNRLIWTPPFPAWLDYPGFWDKALYYIYEIEPVFTWTILDEERKGIGFIFLDRAGRFIFYLVIYSQLARSFDEKVHDYHIKI